AVVLRVLVELDQVPVVPRSRRPGLVGVVELRLLERHVVPLAACDFARLAADAGGDVDVLADVLFALDAAPGNRPGVGRYRSDLEGSGRHRYARSSFTRKALHSGVYAVRSVRVQDTLLTESSARDTA